MLPYTMLQHRPRETFWKRNRSIRATAVEHHAIAGGFENPFTEEITSVDGDINRLAIVMRKDVGIEGIAMRKSGK